MKAQTSAFRAVPAWLGVALIVGAAGVCLAQPAGQDDPAGGDEAAGASRAEQYDKQLGETRRMNLLELLLKGRYFMIPIGLCSLLGLALIVERLVSLRRGAVIPPGFMEGLKGRFRHGRDDRANGMQYCRENPSPLSRIAAAGIRKLHRGEEPVEQAIQDAGAAEVHKLRRNLRLLYGVAAVAPMLGLLGTVWGMITAFQVASQQGLGRAQSLATGIYEALVTTFAGLCVAIPALIFYYYFQGKIERIVGEMNDQSMEFLEHYVSPDPAETERSASAGAEPAPAAS